MLSNLKFLFQLQLYRVGLNVLEVILYRMEEI